MEVGNSEIAGTLKPQENISNLTSQTEQIPSTSSKTLENANTKTQLEIDEPIVKGSDSYFKEKYGKTFTKWYDDEMLSMLEKTGKPDADLMDFFTKSIIAKIGLAAPYKSLFGFSHMEGKDFYRFCIQLDYFFKFYPDYDRKIIVDVIKNLHALELFQDNGKDYLTLPDRTFRNYIYRGEVGAKGLGEHDLAATFENYLKHGGIVTESGIVSTALDPIISITQFTTFDGGLWIIDKSALKDLKNDPANHGETLMLFHEKIPFKYVTNFLTSSETRDKLLKKHGEDSTEIFGRPMKDVIIEMTGEDGDKNLYKVSMLKKVIETNSAKSSVVPVPTLATA